MKILQQKGFIPENVRLSFYTGAFFFLAAVLYTVFTSKEYPPSDLGYKEKVKKSNKGFWRWSERNNQCFG
jgi:maltose/moltooligosaccharide transporter